LQLETDIDSNQLTKIELDNQEGSLFNAKVIRLPSSDSQHEHWQDASGELLKRWDNAAHHPEIKTSPHHVHDGAEENVLPHKPISAEAVLTLIAAEAVD
jgi:hypothetical protein